MKEITENNILLAEFLDWRKNTVVSDGKGRYYDFICPDGMEIVEEHEDCYCSDCGRSNTTKSYLYGEDLLFHRDWNWLMLVVSRIESLTLETLKLKFGNHEDEFTNATFVVFISPIETKIDIFGDMKREKDFIVVNDCTDKLRNTYEACVEFVEWYNNNK